MTAEYTPLPRLFLDAVERFANPRAQMYRTAAGWRAISAGEMLRRVAGLAKALAALGIRSGDRVGIFAPNCPEWHEADFAIQGLGAVVVPVYFRESPERLTYILKDSGARIAFTAGEEQSSKLAECRQNLPTLEHVISTAGADDFSNATPDAERGSAPRYNTLRYQDLIAAAGEVEIADYRRRAAEVTSNQLATIIYTSGTTGEPKGVMLSHANLSSNSRDFTGDFELSLADVALSLLPLAHVYERTIDYGNIFRGVSIAYVEQPESVAQALMEVRPTTMAAVPRFYEKTYANIIEKGHRESGLKRKIFDDAMRVAAKAMPWRAHGKSVPWTVKLRWRIADRLVYSKIRAGVGGRIRIFSSGGAPLAPELAEFFWSVGLPVYQGYGLTETSPVVTFNSPKLNKVGTVGRPIPNVQVRLADDGEILVKGPCVMQGYYQKPEETREVLTPDGWFSTGDIGRIDADGFLSITDRKKELLKTAGGKFVAPAPIENMLKTSPLISNAMVVGDRRKFVSVLVVVNFAGIEEEARKAGREFSTAAQAIRDPWVRDLMSHEIERLTSSLRAIRKAEALRAARTGFHVREWRADLYAEAEAARNRGALSGHHCAAVRGC